jgi:thiol-disulfide isomerase/thioredoxin
MAIFLMLAGTPAMAQSYHEIDAEDLARLLGDQDDTTYVINFWATWCSPCIQEIPYFEALHRDSGDRPLRIRLVSLDFPSRAERQLKPFLQEQSISAEVYLMTDLDYNSWIDRVDPDWSGALPATLIYHGDRRTFLEGELSEEELKTNVESIMSTYENKDVHP